MSLRYRSKPSAQQQQFKQGQSLLERGYESLTPAAQLAHIKAMVEDYFLDEKKHRIPEEGQLLEWVTIARAAIQEAQKTEDIIAALQKLGKQFGGWAFIHGDTKNETRKRSQEIKELANKIYLIAPHAISQQPETYQQYKNGLPPELIKAILEDPSFGITIFNGGAGNPCGHAALAVKTTVKTTEKTVSSFDLFHIDRTLNGRPKHLTNAQTNVYVKNNDKKILTIDPVQLPDINGAIVKLDTLVRPKWRWLGPINNCLTFCYEVLAGGGYNAKSREEFLDIPSVHRKQSFNKELPNSSIPITERHFSETDLRTKNISGIKVSERYKPEEAVKFLLFVTSNFEQVVEWQENLTQNHPLDLIQYKLKKGFFSQSSDDKTRTMMAVDKVCKKILAVHDAIDGKYGILFQEAIIGKDLRNKLDKIAQTIRTNRNNPDKLVFAFNQASFLAKATADKECCSAAIVPTP